MVAVVQRTLAEKGNEMMQTVADHWIEQGIEQGIETGRIQMLREDVLDLLAIRLGATPPHVVEKVTAVTSIDSLRQLHREAAIAPTMAAFSQTLAELLS
ncbi:MAG: hypothetical protein HS099_00505 [Ardenticatenaceae bacterium]|nr:hypothetical protein [Ardenticatenaceae bacterium]